MSFVRTKKFSNGRVYYYLVEGHRDKNDGNKVKQKVIKYLGKEPPADGVILGLLTKAKPASVNTN
ncbi:unnamed protein product [marine sediment metagenome]|uniref:Uncharacterized protein n=1 Tax=marine sediment metagenome TaxID=412755 RepID=X1R164_9ZZZZ